MAKTRNITAPLMSDDMLERLSRLDSVGRGTRSVLGISTAAALRLRADEIIKQVTINGEPVVVKNTDSTGKALRGRPAIMYTLTAKGRKRVKRYQARVAAA